MKQRFSKAFLAALGVAWMSLTAGPVAANEPKVVVELFTSQGCSSCPAADKLLADLAKDPSILPISLSVDYWDYLGWKDTLALPGHVKRQRGYSGVRGDRAVYTPQAIINGTMHVLGSDRQAIERAVKQVRANPQRPSLAVDVTVADGRVNVVIPAGPQPAEPVQVWLCPVAKAVPVNIGRGENRGHTITYTNSVRGWIRLGEWKGEELRISKPVSDISAKGKFDAVAILVQAGKPDAPGLVYGAATASLP